MNAVAKLAKWLGVRTWYHVSFMYPTSGGYATGFGAFQLIPWATSENIFDLPKLIKTDDMKAGCMPTITSITRIGA